MSKFIKKRSQIKNLRNNESKRPNTRHSNRYERRVRSRAVKAAEKRLWISEAS